MINNKEILDNSFKELSQYVDMVKTGEYKTSYIIYKIEQWANRVISVSIDVDNELKKVD